MKDPLDARARAYEVLGLTQNATLAEISAAYARLAAKQPARRQELTNAWQRLRRPETRIEEDFWYYLVEADGQAGGKVVTAPAADQDGPFRWDPVLPRLEVGLELTDLADGRWRRDFSPLETRDVTLSHLERYDEEPTAAHTPVFDR